jgi:hypothetical protein
LFVERSPCVSKHWRYQRRGHGRIFGRGCRFWRHVESGRGGWFRHNDERRWSDDDGRGAEFRRSPKQFWDDEHYRLTRVDECGRSCWHFGLERSCWHDKSRRRFGWRRIFRGH